MNKILSLLLILSIIQVTFSAEEENPPLKLSPQIMKKIQASEDSILKAYKVERAKLIKELQESKLQYMKSNSLQEAVNVDNLIKDINEKDFLLTDIIKNTKEKADLLGNPINQKVPLEKWIVGKKYLWLNRELVTFQPNGVMELPPPWGAPEAKWHLKANNEIVITTSQNTYDLTFNETYSEATSIRNGLVSEKVFLLK